MLDFESGTFVELDPGFTPSPSGGGLCLLQQEEAYDGYLIIWGYVPGLHAPDRQQASALVTIVGMIQSVFGYPNEEAFWFDSRTYGSRHPARQAAAQHEHARHFFVGSKDDSAQFLARGLRVETFTDRPYKAVRDEALRRMNHWSTSGAILPPGDGRHAWSYPEDIE